MNPTAFTGPLGVRHPLVLAPMAGGPSTPTLCAAVSEAGGLGSHGGAYLPTAKLRDDIRAIRAATSRPFAINLFADDGAAGDERTLRAAQEAVTGYRAQLGLPPPAPPAPLSNAPIAPYPIQNALTREIRAAAAKLGDPGLLSLWAGQAAVLAREMPARELVAQLVHEAEAVISSLRTEP
jgi:NAD(P)H-dependent flavin oxidoreductase YrpB (nitropropane dioxygenase family)